MWATRLDPDEWTLAIPQDLRDRLWQESQSQAQDARSWTAYLNRLCIETFEKLWVEMGWEEKLKAWPSLKDLPSFWEFTTGTALTLGKHRLVIIPTDTVDASELSVPQEWVDIPSWMGDYYISAQIDPPVEHLQILGYVTHKQLKSQGEYDAFDRSYCIDTEDLISWDAFQPSYHHYSPSQTQVAVPALPALEPAQAKQLIPRLGAPELLIPRLEVPFAQWGALLENETWREQLFNARQGQAPAPSVANLLAWLKGQIEPGWQMIETVRSLDSLPDAPRGPRSQPTPARAMRSPAPPSPLLTLGKQLSEIPVSLSVGITPLETEQLSVVITLDPTSTDIEAGLALRIIDQTTESVLMAASASQPGDMIQLALKADPGDRFDVEISLEDTTIIERFEL